MALVPYPTRPCRSETAVIVVEESRLQRKKPPHTISSLFAAIETCVRVYVVAADIRLSASTLSFLLHRFLFPTRDIQQRERHCHEDSSVFFRTDIGNSYSCLIGDDKEHSRVDVRVSF